MEDIVSRPKYSRHNVSRRKRRNNIQGDSRIADKLLGQIIVCVALLIAVGAFKSIDTPATNFLTDKIKNEISRDIEPKAIYNKAEQLLSYALEKVWGTQLQPEKNSTDDEPGEEIDNASLPYEGDKGAYAEGELKGASGEATGEEYMSDGELVSFIKSRHQFVVPVAGALTSGFGDRVHPVTGENEFHTGIDIEAEIGEPIKAALDGKVIEAESSDTYGNYIKIQHEDDITTMYGHCSKLMAEEGQDVKKGNVIASAGDTGISAGAHLHFEVWKGGKALNPEEFVKVPSE
ncbi:peptidase M23-like protein [Anaerobacterium chartisolvens]|uniref:Peptidase M23-like protein n=1 Tax=Anaerobacterium chartisolvens TaxID=1297424 RepID=A0A369BHR2_9FIRM|nr:M23 family metallopeptidase [Anaerobacterium chartisolvens]RCX20805.1 peptidase M23-like protein [Anaerobacterium chartisolvens]